MIEQKPQVSPTKKSLRLFFIEVFHFSLLKELCFLHKKVEVRKLFLLTSHKKLGDESYGQPHPKTT